LAAAQTVLGQLFRQRHHIEQFDLGIHGLFLLITARSM
jgi:hypothetical protein